MKICGRCQTNKDESEFSKRSKARDGLKPWCRDCDKKWYEEHREQHLSNVNRRNAKMREERGRFLVSYLRSNPCVDCGEADLVVLDFDHVRGEKKFNVVEAMLGGYKWESVLDEIAKCDIRCANCHRRATAQRNGWIIRLVG